MIERVSVVVITYRRDDTLKQCLESLAAQTLSLHEVVVVDDGGSGSARAVVEHYGERFRYLWQPNSGQQRARNIGSRAASGEWIAYLDDDDLWMPTRHALLAEVIATGQVDVIAGDFIKFGVDWLSPTGVFYEISLQSPGFWNDIPHEPKATYSIVGSFPTTRLIPVSPFWPSALAIRRDLFETLKGWSEELRGIKSEDFEFVFRAIKFGNLGIIWQPTVHYRSHDGNDSNSNLLVALGRTVVWETLLRKQNLTDFEKLTLTQAVEKSHHQILWTAFNEKRFDIVLSMSKKIEKNKLTLTEKAKLKIAIGMATPYKTR